MSINSGFFEKSLPGKDSLLSYRKMYLQNNCLIDIIGNVNVHEGKYVKTDTLTYDFYDLVNQKYVLFEKFSTDAKIIKRGSMAMDGSFSNVAKFDPLYGVADSVWKITDTVINGKAQKIISFILTGITDSLDREFTKRTKFWVDPGIENFPIQLSYILSGKLNSSFVYKMQNPFLDGKTVMLTTLDYKTAKLPDTLTRILERWTQIARR